MDDLVKFIKMIQNPQEYVMNIAKQQSNPILQNMIDLAQKGEKDKVLEIARNICKSQGRDFDKEFSQIQSLIK